MTHTRSPSASSRSIPSKVCASWRSQWNPMPIVTSGSVNEDCGEWGANVSVSYDLSCQRSLPSFALTVCGPVCSVPSTMKEPSRTKATSGPLVMPTATLGSCRRRNTLAKASCPSATSPTVFTSREGVSRSKSSLRGVMTSPAMSSAPGEMSMRSASHEAV